MTDDKRQTDATTADGSAPADFALVVRRTIRAAPRALFDAWTRADLLIRWWGPAGVACIGAEIDLQPGGSYRIGNRLPDGQTLWIAGVFERITPPRELIYSWSIEGAPTPTVPERVTVRFEAHGDATDVIVIHERAATAAIRDQHAHGWEGCLDGLARMLG
ncbi:MAG: SRPBCC domain-containing protein [Burkholderiales bacterium]